MSSHRRKHSNLSVQIRAHSIAKTIKQENIDKKGNFFFFFFFLKTLTLLLLNFTEEVVHGKFNTACNNDLIVRRAKSTDRRKCLIRIVAVRAALGRLREIAARIRAATIVADRDRVEARAIVLCQLVQQRIDPAERLLAGAQTVVVQQRDDGREDRRRRRRAVHRREHALQHDFQSCDRRRPRRDTCGRSSSTSRPAGTRRRCCDTRSRPTAGTTGSAACSTHRRPWSRRDPGPSTPRPRRAAAASSRCRRSTPARRAARCRSSRPTARTGSATASRGAACCTSASSSVAGRGRRRQCRPTQ
jgi:hypothetical protein